MRSSRQFRAAPVVLLTLLGLAAALLDPALPFTSAETSATELCVGTFNIRNFPENSARREGLQGTAVGSLGIIPLVSIR